MRKRERRYLRQMLDGSAASRGRISEQTLLDAVLAVSHEYPWVSTARKSTPAEDARGIDIVVETSWGQIFLQAKSSYAKALEWTTKPREDHIEIVVVPLRDDIARARAREALENGYQRYRKNSG